jgi:hypothetical protein
MQRQADRKPRRGYTPALDVLGSPDVFWYCPSDD